MFDESQSEQTGLEKHGPTSQETELQQHPSATGSAPATEILEICSGCQTGIADKYLLRIRSLAWHEQCATCCVCNCQLSEGCFVRNNRLYCPHDYARRHGIRCQSCGQPIATQDLAMWAHSYAYHLACFVCAACGAQLRKGDQFAVRPSDGRPVCLCDAASVIGSGGDCSGGSSSSAANFCPDERQFTPLRNHPAGVGASSAVADDATSACGRRRARTVLTANQRRRFRLVFEQNPRPARQLCEALAGECGLAVRVVQVWFQNQRAQLKKRSCASSANAAGGADSSSPRQLRSGRRGRPSRQQSSLSASTSQQSSEFADDCEAAEDGDFEDDEADYEEADDLDDDGEGVEEDGSAMGGLVIAPPPPMESSAPPY